MYRTEQGKKLLVGVGVVVGTYIAANTAIKTAANTASVTSAGHITLDKASTAARFILVPARRAQ